MPEARQEVVGEGAGLGGGSVMGVGEARGPSPRTLSLTTPLSVGSGATVVGVA